MDLGLVCGAVGVIGIPAAIGLTMAATSPGEFRFVRGCFILAALLTFASAIWLTHEMPLGIAKIVIVGAIGAVAAIGLVVAFDWVAQKQHMAAPEDSSVAGLDNTISISCAWSKPPSHYREDKTLVMVDFQGIPVTGVDFNRQSAGPMRFVRSSEPFPVSEHYSDMWYRCDIINHGSQPVRSVWAKFPVVYNAVVRAENGTRSGEMIAAGFARSSMFDLAPGESDFFYFANACAAFVTIFPPKTVMLQTMADDAVHQVRVVTSSGWQIALMPSPKPLNAPVDQFVPQ